MRCNIFGYNKLNEYLPIEQRKKSYTLEELLLIQKEIEIKDKKNEHINENTELEK